MNEVQNTLLAIESKVQQLLAERVVLLEEIQSLQGQCNQLQNAINELNETINNLKIYNNNNLEQRNTLTQEEDAENIKLKINQLIAAIDASLAKLATTK